VFASLKTNNTFTAGISQENPAVTIFSLNLMQPEDACPEQRKFIRIR
jgi:hypothetical protein